MKSVQKGIDAEMDKAIMKFIGDKKVSYTKLKKEFSMTTAELERVINRLMKKSLVYDPYLIYIRKPNPKAGKYIQKRYEG